MTAHDQILDALTAIRDSGLCTDRHYRHAKRFKVGQTEEDE